jgi:hypothetical protein
MTLFLIMSKVLVSAISCKGLLSALLESNKMKYYSGGNQEAGWDLDKSVISAGSSGLVSALFWLKSRANKFSIIKCIVLAESRKVWHRAPFWREVLQHQCSCPVSHKRLGPAVQTSGRSVQSAVTEHATAIQDNDTCESCQLTQGSTSQITMLSRN